MEGVIRRLRTRLIEHGANAPSDCASAYAIIETRPDAVLELAYDMLHAYPFKDVPFSWRCVYEDASLWKVLNVLQARYKSDKCVSEKQRLKGEAAAESNDESEWRRDVVWTCDMALIMSGAPRLREFIDQILDLHSPPSSVTLSSALPLPQVREPLSSPSSNGVEWRQGQEVDEEHEERPTKRRRADDTTTAQDAVSIPVVSHPVTRVHCPSLQAFEKLSAKYEPIALTGAVEHWPALDRWKLSRYWLDATHNGQRLVPVEMGRSYTDEDWSQKIIPFGTFLSSITTRSSSCFASGQQGKSEEKSESKSKSKNAEDTQEERELKNQVLYLAQHDLLTQIPRLRRDVAIPDYCYLSLPSTSAASSTLRPTPQSGRERTSENSEDEEDGTSEVIMNIWLGPCGTISPAHTDPHHNILVQVVGAKYIRLWSPAQTSCMYPIGRAKVGGVDMGNTSSVEVSSFLEFLDTESHPLKAKSPNLSKQARTPLPSSSSSSSTSPSSTSDKVNDHRHIVSDSDSDKEDSDDDDDNDVVVVATDEDDNREAVDPGDKWPLHAQASYLDCILRAGEALYIPRGWWHFVMSINADSDRSFEDDRFKHEESKSDCDALHDSGVSCSVSFWWD